MRLLTALCLIPLLLAAARADEPPPAAPADVARLRENIAELQRVRGAFESQRQSHRQQIDDLNRQLDRLRSDRASVAPALETQRQHVERLGAVHAGLTQEIAAITQQLEAISAAATPAAAKLGEQVRSGIPIDRQARTEAVTSIHEQLQQPPIVPRLAAVQALAAWAGDEMALSHDRGVANVPLVLADGRRAHGYQARLGLVAALFLGEDGRTIAAADAGRWQFDLAPDERRSVLQIVRILQGQAPPAIVPLPRPAAPAKEATP